jgi:putative RNA 2'-phosphotransferase
MSNSSKKARETTSKFLSYVLRHQPEAIGLTLDAEGWANLADLISGAAQHGRALDIQGIREVVAENDKQRFAFSEDGLSIRAVQGHSSAAVQRKYAAKIQMEFLWHGTATRFLASIRQQGLLPGSRHHVHLSAEPETAHAVGTRYGKPVVLKIEAGRMQAQGFVFFQAENGVWLTEHVPVAFILEP